MAEISENSNLEEANRERALIYYDIFKELEKRFGKNEIEEAGKINAINITNNKKSLDIMELAGLIKKSSFIIANDTGPAHMSAHLGSEGIVLFGYHTTPKKVSIETDKFKAITVNNLNDLLPEDVYSQIKDKLELINR